MVDLKKNRDYYLSKGKKLKEEMKMKSSVNDKIGFLSGVTHDLREPLNGIKGALQLLEEYTNDQEIDDYVNLLKKSVDNLENIINDIIDFSDIESAELKLNYSSFNATDLIESIMDFFKNIAVAKNISLNYFINDKSNSMLAGDERRIKQIISNILSMAIRRTSVGGVFLSVDVIAKNSSYVDLKFKIKDTQSDIKDAAYDFFSDVGFYVSKNLIEIMGGDIEIKRDSYGNMISFFIRVKKDVKTHAKSEGDEGDSGIKDLKILIADDDLISQRLMKILFAKKKWSAKGVRNGLEAVNEYMENDYDIVILDLNMPVMDGLEACQQIRKYQKKNDIYRPIIALTGHETKFYKNTAYEKGVDYYMIKPVDIRELYSTTSKLVSKYKSLNENQKDPDIRQALINLGGDKNLLKDMIYVFLNTSFLEDIMENISYAIERSSLEDMLGNLKNLKDSMEMLGAKRSLELCYKLEQNSKYDMDDSKSVFVMLEEEISRIRSFFMNYSL